MLDYRTVVFEGYNKLLKTGLFTDVKVQVACQVFDLHKVVLCANSEYFLAMFTCPMREIAMKIIYINTIDPDIFQLIITCMYTGFIAIDERNCRDIMYAADLLLMRQLVEACCEYMVQRIDIHNCIDMMHVADAHSCNELKQAALTFICQNIPQVSTTVSFLHMDFHEVELLLDNKDLHCLSEVDILKAALRWITHNVTERKLTAFKLLSSVRFQSISIRDLDNAVRSVPKVEDKAFAVVISSLRNDLSTGKLFRNPKFCKPKRGSRYVLLFGGVMMDNFGSGSGSTDVYRYDVANDEWLQLENCTHGRYKHALSMVGNRVYLLGGNNEFFSVTSSVECYNITTGVWTDKCPMLECRKSPQVTTVNGRMYVMSSEDSEDSQPIIEVYDHACNKWRPYVSNLGWQPADNTVSKVHDDKLYEWVNGNKRAFLRVTPLYMQSNPDSQLDIGVFGDPDYPHPQLSYKRHKCAMVILGEQLYVIGGCMSLSESDTSPEVGRSVSRLDLSKNTWDSVCPMSFARSGHTAEAINNKLYVFGGHKSQSAASFMEVYDPHLDTWECRREPVNFLFAASVVY